MLSKSKTACVETETKSWKQNYKSLKSIINTVRVPWYKDNWTTKRNSVKQSPCKLNVSDPTNLKLFSPLGKENRLNTLQKKYGWSQIEVKSSFNKTAIQKMNDIKKKRSSVNEMIPANKTRTTKHSFINIYE